MFNNPGDNASNINGWMKSSPIVDKENCDICRNTTQTLVLIVYDNSYSTHEKFRNTIIMNRTVMRSYGNGEIFGMSKLGSIRSLEGFFPPNHGFGILSFDNTSSAMSFCGSKTEIREQFWLGGVTMYTLPLSTPCKSPLNNSIIQLDFYDIKNSRNFSGYLRDIFPIASKFNGLVIAGTADIRIIRGTRKPRYLLMIQWSSPEDIHSFNNEAKPLLFHAGAACCSRIVFEMDPMSHW